MFPAHPNRRGSSVLLAGASAALLLACTSPPPAPAAAPPVPPKASTTPPAAGNTGPAAPRLVVSAPIAAALSTFTKNGVTYHAVLQKATFTYDDKATGTVPLKLLTADLDPLALDATIRQGVCSAQGSAFNEQTVDYPYAAVMTRGASLDAVAGPDRKPMKLRAMDDSGTPNQSVFSGVGKRSIEMAYDRCVGGRKADGPGHRLDTYLPDGARIALRPAGSPQALSLTLDERFVPYILLQHKGNRWSAAPSRIVLVDIDAPTRRVHVHYRALFRASPAIEQVDLRALTSEAPAGTASDSETPQAARKRTAALLAHLSRCERRTGYSEPCADIARPVPAEALR
ncbi:hypothetical protein [Hydrogenophaga sp. RWCD_12]|uniref:hypothetical protein n=1 Tax=Hydrogenophaga sp. RWCD_12 TaxID=3391190 RepID=UPI0039853687